MNEMRIYVASLSDYNNGRLEGKWLDLSDYSDASELMEAIQEMLDDLTKKYNDGEVREEWAVHDYEGIPSTLASEYMGEQDFQQLYDIAEVADDRGIPVEVLIERAGDTGSDDYQALDDSLIMSVNGNDESDIVYEYENQIGELGFDWWSNHVGITITDQRLLYGEDVDNFKEEILAENPDMDESEAEGQAEEMADAEEEARNSDLIEYLNERGYYDEFPNWVYKDYEKAWKSDLSYEFDVIHHDGRMYVFTNNYGLGGTILSGMIGAYIGYKVGRAKPQKKGFETEKKIGRKIKGAFSKKKMARGGGVYSSDTMYELKVFDGKSNEFLTSVRYRARNQREANEIGQDYEYEMQQKYGDYLRFVVSEAKPLMAKGGGVAQYPNDLPKEEAERLFHLSHKNGKVGDRLWNNFKRTPLRLIYSNLENRGIKYAQGGGIGFKGLSSKVAKRYEGKAVAPKYQGEYGKRYSKSEAKEVGDKVAGKVYWAQKNKMALGGKAKGVEWMKSDGQYEAELGDLYLIISPATERGLYQVRVKKGYRGETIGVSTSEINGLDKAKDLAYDIAGDYYKQFAQGGGVEKDSNYYEIIRKIENNERMLKNTYGSERVEKVQQEIQRLKDELKNKYGHKYAQGGGVEVNTEVILTENRSGGAKWRGVVKPFMLKSIEDNQYRGGFKRYEIDIYDEVNREPSKEELKEANKFFEKIGGRYAQGGGISGLNDLIRG